jgi:hypothetical protein
LKNIAETRVFLHTRVQGNDFPAGVWGKAPKKVYLDYLALLRYNGKE